MQIRPARQEDAAAVTAIYAHHVLHGTGTFEEEPPSIEEMTARMAHIAGRGWPWLVAEEGGVILGYAYCGQFRDRAAYRFAGEDAVYVLDSARGRGVGFALLEALVPAAANAGFRRMFAVIGDSANAGSIRLHERAGFVRCGMLHDAGFKFGRLLDVVFMERALP
ncbi:N-acetyltransferase family protein [Sphingomonas sp. ID0503]|uniref:GNAT family N-acetyltransferase n=1 Tax=Sphingomonas sp. ID0503 TaxID=3399691 RepID=UPI003AFA22DC